MIYSVNMYCGPSPTASPIVYTVPEGLTGVVRDIEVLNYSGGVQSVQVFVEVSGVQGTVIFANELPNLEPVQWKGRVVIPAGSTLGVSVGLTDVQFLISGYQLGP